MLRFAGALHLVGGHIVIEAELDTASVARRLRKDIADIFGSASELQMVSASGIRKSSRWLVRVTKDGERLARQVLGETEVPDCKLSTLASYFQTPTVPSHRALADARATAAVLHGLIGRLAASGVRTLAEISV